LRRTLPQNPDPSSLDNEDSTLQLLNQLRLWHLSKTSRSIDILHISLRNFPLFQAAIDMRGQYLLLIPTLLFTAVFYEVTELNVYDICIFEGVESSQPIWLDAIIHINIIVADLCYLFLYCHECLTDCHRVVVYFGGCSHFWYRRSLDIDILVYREQEVVWFWC
jgi:hypothetical protein